MKDREFIRNAATLIGITLGLTFGTNEVLATRTQVDSNCRNGSPGGVERSFLKEAILPPKTEVMSKAVVEISS